MSQPINSENILELILGVFDALQAWKKCHLQHDMRPPCRWGFVVFWGSPILLCERIRSYGYGQLWVKTLVPGWYPHSWYSWMVLRRVVWQLHPSPDVHGSETVCSPITSYNQSTFAVPLWLASYESQMLTEPGGRSLKWDLSHLSMRSNYAEQILRSSSKVWWFSSYLVVYLPLWKIWKSVGMIIPNMMEKYMFQTTNQIYCYFND